MAILIKFAMQNKKLASHRELSAMKFGKSAIFPRVALIAMALTFLQAPAFAWGEVGHQAVAAMAARLLNEPTKQMVQSVLKVRPHDMAMRRNALWASQNPLRDTPNWHNASVPPNGGAYDPARDCPGGSCIVEKVGELRRTIVDPAATADARSDAMAYLINFVADVHIPMNAAGAPGALWIKISDKTQKLNLWWDDAFVRLIGDEALTISAILAPKITADQTKLWSNGTPADWTNESFAVSRELIARNNLQLNAQSGSAEAEAVILTPAALEDIKTIVAQRLAMAAVRLAWILNNAGK